ncbi:hypothetical protein HPB51_021293 [Rhipicephalus microplus]|uniref:Uncharacterized protein n=1 Tax=Rhipicephalus microplus TaxID=6941 RepID=A0A9J6F7H8_RHIMP|nr:hypothetical protein HPB51_021293 [Rhipicephalus microplus]
MTEVPTEQQLPTLELVPLEEVPALEGKLSIEEILHQEDPLKVKTAERYGSESAPSEEPSAEKLASLDLVSSEGKTKSAEEMSEICQRKFVEEETRAVLMAPVTIKGVKSVHDIERTVSREALQLESLSGSGELTESGYPTMEMLLAQIPAFERAPLHRAPSAGPSLELPSIDLKPKKKRRPPEKPEELPPALPFMPEKENSEPSARVPGISMLEEGVSVIEIKPHTGVVETLAQEQLPKVQGEQELLRLRTGKVSLVPLFTERPAEPLELEKLKKALRKSPSVEVARAAVETQESGVEEVEKVVGEEKKELSDEVIYPDMQETKDLRAEVSAREEAGEAIMKAASQLEMQEKEAVTEALDAETAPVVALTEVPSVRLFTEESLIPPSPEQVMEETEITTMGVQGQEMLPEAEPGETLVAVSAEGAAQPMGPQEMADTLIEELVLPGVTEQDALTGTARELVGLVVAPESQGLAAAGMAQEETEQTTGRELFLFKGQEQGAVAEALPAKGVPCVALTELPSLSPEAIFPPAWADQVKEEPQIITLEEQPMAPEETIFEPDFIHLIPLNEEKRSLSEESVVPEYLASPPTFLDASEESSEGFTPPEMYEDETSVKAHRAVGPVMGKKAKTEKQPLSPQSRYTPIRPPVEEPWGTPRTAHSINPAWGRGRRECVCKSQVLHRKSTKIRKKTAS